ncbi:EamA family transporter [Phenylobacterium sp.]|jgi:O-acetylserine/cysteine efflux transporter|uniref:EamA family transporter n=1 Tax=Phenylobacterium sp. TaxID=1871053 RepID=UPI002E3609DF|nr:EamA family transporter [Phenylobacterium sp.]HEX2562005.1 EamA family transporter [Phenylobacterium sp.]
MSSTRLSWPHALLALAVTAVWGTNFVVIRWALDDLPPFTLAALRFTFAALPAIFFVRRPTVPWRDLAAYGLLIGAGQFGLLFLAMDGHISPGLASLVVQAQVFFTVGMAMVISHERLRGYQWAALVLGAAGLAVIALRSQGDATLLGLGLVLLAALCWAGGNLVARRSPQASMLAFVIWSSLFSAPPLILLALFVEGPAAIADGVRAADAGTWGAVAWQTVGNTLFGYSAWGFLLARNAAAAVSPMALLVPVFGMGASALLLGEGMPAWKLAAAALVLGGLALNLLWPLLGGARAAGVAQRTGAS